MDVRELDRRREVYQAIAAKPGITGRRLQRRLGLAADVVDPRVKQLLAAKLVHVERLSTPCFYPTPLDPRDARVLAAMRAALPRRILILLATKPLTRRQLLAALNVPSSTLTHHLGWLMNLGLIRDEGEVFVNEHTLVVPHPARVQALYIRHRSGRLDRWTDGFLAAADALRRPPS